MADASTDPGTDPARPTISVLIPARDAGATIDDQLAALAAQDYDGEWEVIVADNGSTDDTVEKARGWADRLPAIRVVDASERPGANHAKNVAVRAARGEFLLCCDADDVVGAGWLASMADAARDADIIGGRLDEDELNDDSVRSLGLNLTQGSLPVALGFLPYAMGGNFGIRASVLKELGGWNPAYVKGGGDVDLSWRAQLRDFKISYVPNSVVHVRHRGDLRTLARQRYLYGLGTTRLYQDFHPYGIPKDNLIAGLRVWKRLLLRLPHLVRGPNQRGAWIRDASYSFGILVGLIRRRLWKL